MKYNEVVLIRSTGGSKMKKFNLKSMAVGTVVGVGLITSALGASTLLKGNVYISTFPIMLNGKSYISSSKILNYEGTTYVPLRELSTVTGSEVNFKDNTIYIENNAGKTSTSTSTTPVTTVKLNPTTSFTQKELEIDKTYTVTVNLSKYGASKAVISTSNNCVKLSQTSYTTTGLLTITGYDSGKATVTVKYDTGDIEYIYVTVPEDDSKQDYEIKVGSSDTYTVDLKEYKADKATVTITEGETYVTINKTSFTSSANLKITGKKVGEATIKVKYDSGDIIYLYVNVVKSSSSSSSDNDIELDVGDSITRKIDPDDYNAEKAVITIMSGSSYVTLSKTSFTGAGTLKITGKNAGEAKLRIKYDDDDTEYIYVTVNDDDDDNDFEISVDESKTVYIDLEDYDADEAEVSVSSGSSYVTLSKTSFTKSGNLRITGKKAGEATIKVKYDSGDTEKIYVTVVDDDEEYDYEDRITLSVDDYDYIYVDLDYYDADSAELKILTGSDVVSIAKTEVTKNTKVKVTADDTGEAIIRIKYDTKDLEYYYIKVK